LFIVFIASNTFGQDAIFSQYYNSGIYLNPALSSSEPSVAVSLNSRLRRLGNKTSFSTNQFSFLYPIKDKSAFTKIGTALSFVQDRAGVGNLSSTGGYLNLSYNVKLMRNQSVSFGVQGGYLQKYLDVEKLSWNSQYVENEGWDESLTSGENFGDNRIGFADINAGLFYVNTFGEEVSNTAYLDKKGFYAGVSVYHLTEPKDFVTVGGESVLSRRINFHAGGGFMISNKILLSPNALYVIQGEFSQLNVGVLGDYYLSEQKTGIQPSDITFGLWYRLNESFILSAGVFNDSYEFGFSFDYDAASFVNVVDFGSNVPPSPQSVYELYLKLRLPTKGESITRKPRYIILD